MQLNLTAKNLEQEKIKEFLEANASELLAEKINNGIRIEKDGKQLVSKKDIDSFLDFATKEAQKAAENGARFSFVDNDTVFGRAIHYFEEDSIEGVLYNEDGTKYIVSPPPKPKQPEPAKFAKEKPMDLFDYMNLSASNPSEAEPQNFAEPGTAELSLAAQAQEQQAAQEDNDEETEMPTELPEQEDDEAADELTQISETQYVDKDGVVYDVYPSEENTANETQAAILKLFHNEIIAR